MADAVLYAVEVSRLGGDIGGQLITADGEVLYQHMSSSPGWLLRDLTRNFGRDIALAERFGDHFGVVYVGLDEGLPAEIAHHFNSPDNEEQS